MNGDFDKIKNELLDIRHNIQIDYHMREIFRIKGAVRQQISPEEYKAILSKMIIDSFGHTYIADYFFAIFGLWPEYNDPDLNFTRRCRKLLESIAYATSDEGLREKRLEHSKKKDSPYNYAKSRIKESDRIRELTEYIAKIEDLKEYANNISEYTTVTNGKLVALLPKPSYLDGDDIMQRWHKKSSDINNMHILWNKTLNSKNDSEKHLQRGVDILNNMYSYEVKKLLEVFSFSGKLIEFDDTGMINCVFDPFPFDLSNPIIEIEELVCDADGRLIYNGKTLGEYRLGLGELYYYEFDILEEFNLTYRKKNEEILWLNEFNYAFVIGSADKYAIIIKQTEPYKFKYILRYEAPIFNQPAQELYYSAEVASDANIVASLARDWKNTFREIGDKGLNISLREVTLFDEEFGFIEFGDEDLLETRFAEKKINKTSHNEEDFMHLVHINKDEYLPF